MSKKKQGRAYSSVKKELYDDVVSALRKISFVNFDDIAIFADADQLEEDPGLIDSAVWVEYKLSDKADLVALRNALNAYLGEEDG